MMINLGGMNWNFQAQISLQAHPAFGSSAVHVWGCIMDFSPLDVRSGSEDDPLAGFGRCMVDTLESKAQDLQANIMENKM